MADIAANAVPTMGTLNMPEPTSSTAAGAVGWKLIGGLAGLGTIGAALAAVVVMCMTPPHTRPEWAVALISTVMSSIGIGSLTIHHFGLQAWAYDPYGLVSLLALVFVCGLPGWAIIRWIFNFIAKREGRGIDEVVRELRGVAKP